MFAEHRALMCLRKLSRTGAITRYAGAMYRTRLYSRYTTDQKLARQMDQQYRILKETPIGRRIIALGQRRSKKHEK